MIKSHWMLVSLEKICDPDNGIQIGPFGTQLHATEYVDTGIPVVMPRDIKNGEICLNSIDFISEEKANKLKKYRLKVGDIIVGRRGTIGNFALVKNEQEGWLCGTDCIRLRLKPGFHPEFIVEVLRTHTIQHWLIANAVGQTMLGLNTEIISNVPLHIPDSLNTQILLATYFHKWDRAIALTEKLIAAKRRLKQGLMQQILTGKRRFPEFQNIPWEKLVLGKACDITMGGTPARKEPDYWAQGSEDGFPWLTIRDMVGRQVTKTQEYITEKGVLESNTKLVPKGTTLMSFKLTIGRVTQAGCDLYTNEAIAAFYPKENLVHQDYLYAALPLAVKRANTDRAVKGLTLNKGKLEVLPILVPSIKEQEKITHLDQLFDQEISLLLREVELFKRQKNGLMQKLLTGDIQISTLDDAA